MNLAHLFKSRLLLLLAVTGLLLLGGCHRSQGDEAQVLNVLQVRAKALNNRDIASYLSVISPNYDDKGKNLSSLREGLESGFKTYESVAYQADEVRVQISGKNAQATGTFRMKVVLRGREMVLDGKEQLRLTREGDGWKITAGL